VLSCLLGLVSDLPGAVWRRGWLDIVGCEEVRMEEVREYRKKNPNSIRRERKKQFKEARSFKVPRCRLWSSALGLAGDSSVARAPTI
jgi:hypothetical protein